MARATRKPVVGEPAEIAVDKLMLDDQNPRLASGDARVEGKQSQQELVRRLWSEMAVDEVAISIAENGYYPEERLLVVRSESNRDTFTVIEGNRRLAAVKLLLDPELRRAVRATDLPAIDPIQQHELERLPASIYDSRKDLWSYLGFRHINGTRPWDAYSKARYVASVHDTYDVPLIEIADRIGDRHSTVVRFYRGVTVLDQAEQQAGFDIEDRVKSRFAFSHLYTALQYPEFQKFLGISDLDPERRSPVPRSKLTELSELMTWLYGRKSSSTMPVIRSQNPDLNSLRAVVASSRGLSLLRSGRPLDSALEASIGEERRFRESLTRGNEELITAMGTLTNGYDGDLDLLRVGEGVSILASRLHEEMEKKASAKPGPRGASRQ